MKIMFILTLMVLFYVLASKKEINCEPRIVHPVCDPGVKITIMKTDGTVNCIHEAVPYGKATKITTK